MGFPLRALVNPFADQFDLPWVQRPAGRRWRHAPLRRANPLVQAAVRALAGDDDLICAAIGENAIFGVEPQIPLAAVFLRAMAGKAIVRENGANIAVEVYRLFGRARRRLPGV